MKPGPKFILAATIFSSLASFNAHAGTTRTEYRYPDRPDVVYSSDGQVYRTNGSRPMAFSRFEAAISAGDAKQMLHTSGYANDVPQRLPANPAPSAAPKFEPLPEIALGPAPTSYAYVIQAGAFGSHANATRLQSKLQAFGSVRIHEGMKNGKPIFRVQLGGFNSKSSAKPTLDMIKANGFDGYVVSGS